MKKRFIFVTLSTIFAIAAGTGTALAYDNDNYYKSDQKFKAKYTNIAFAWQSLHTNFGYPEVDNLKMMMSDWGLSFSTGQSFVLNPEPLAGVLRVGIDATWLDFNIARLSPNPILGINVIPMEWGGANGGSRERREFRFYQPELSVGVGLSFHLTPIGKLGLHTYVRYNPTASILSDFDTGTMGGYSSVIVFGGAISWDNISLGVEGRWGFGSYSYWGGGEDKALIDRILIESLGSSSLRFKTGGGRVYFGFRF
jgi:hypothetical protein